jgi:hypothetical protein
MEIPFDMRDKCQGRGPLGRRKQFRRRWRPEKGSSVMDEFGGGFLRSVMICFFLALAVSFVFVWFPDLLRP